MSGTFAFGPRAQRVYEGLRDRIVRGEFGPGDRLPSHLDLAAQFGVAPLTLRRVLAQLEADGFVAREQGRGTFVRQRAAPTVLVVDDDGPSRRLLRTLVTVTGYRAVEADGPAAGLDALRNDLSVALVLTDVRMPAASDGIGFIRAVRRRWPDLPLAAITAYPDDLAALHGDPDCPYLIFAKPIVPAQIEQALRLVLPPAR